MSRPALLVLLLALSGCSVAGHKAYGRPPALPSPSASPSQSPSASPSPTLTPTPTPSEKPKPPPAQALDCTGSAPFDRPPATSTSFPGTTTRTGSTAVALTFDDGPDPVTTPRILDLLRQCGVKATFCVNGIKAQANPAMIRRIAHDGHSFCNHTWRHITKLGDYGPQLIREDLAATNDAIRAIVPGAKIGYFRAPGGRWTNDYITVARELGMTPLHWDVDTRDWEHTKYGTGQSMVDQIVHEVQTHVRPGSVVLSHDYQKPDTVTAYRILLPWLKARVTLIALPPDGLA